jgi:hypothetical protein
MFQNLPRVAEVVGTPISPSVPITIEGPEGPLIAFAIVTMLVVGSTIPGRCVVLSQSP